MNKTITYIALLAFTFCACTQKGSAFEKPDFIVDHDYLAKRYTGPAKFLRADIKVYLEIPEGILFDLEADPGETNNIAGGYPHIVNKMQDLAKWYILELGDEGQPGPGVRQAGYVSEAHPMNWKQCFIADN